MNKHYEIGTKIYYRGDIANEEGFGKITELISNKWGEYFSTRLEDGREQKSVPLFMMSDFDTGNGSTRFCTLTAYQKRRQKMIAGLL